MFYRVMSRGIAVEVALLMLWGAAGLAQTGMQPLSTSPGKSAFPATRAGGTGAGQGSGQGSGLTTVPEDFEKLTLAPGFLLGLGVLDDTDMAGTFRIDEQGNLSVPILGTIHVDGETVPEAREQIRNKLLADQILRDPQVNLAVLEYTPPQVTIIGEVAGPGKYPLLVPRKLVDVLALAGGPTITAGNEVQITSGHTGGQPMMVHYSRATAPEAVARVLVNPGDTVQVKRAGIVYVLGAVTRPGGFVMQEEGTLSVLQAIALAYGTTPLASTRTIYLLRKNQDGSFTYTSVPYKKMIHGQSAAVQLHATDVLFVPSDMIKTLYSSTQQLVTAAGTAAIYVGLGY